MIVLLSTCFLPLLLSLARAIDSCRVLISIYIYVCVRIGVEETALRVQGERESKGEGD
jgi:hypothetical protein